MNFRGPVAALARTVPKAPVDCPVQPGLGPLWTWPCSPHTLLYPLTPRRRCSSLGCTSRLCPDENPQGAPCMDGSRPHHGLPGSCR